jgi:hypothetical protein
MGSAGAELIFALLVAGLAVTSAEGVSYNFILSNPSDNVEDAVEGAIQIPRRLKLPLIYTRVTVTEAPEGGVGKRRLLAELSNSTTDLSNSTTDGTNSTMNINWGSNSTTDINWVANSTTLTVSVIVGDDFVAATSVKNKLAEPHTYLVNRTALGNTTSNGTLVVDWGVTELMVLYIDKIADFLIPLLWTVIRV